MSTVATAVPIVEARRPSQRTGPIAFFRTLFRYRQAQLGGFVILVLILTAVFAPVIAPYDPLEVKAGRPLTPPSRDFLFGTDDLGRDQLSRIVYGSRITLRIGLIIVGLEFVIGVSVGLIAGYYGGWLDGVLMRFTDIALAFPGFILALAVISVLGPGLTNAMLAVGIASWPFAARVVRGSVLSVKEMEYVTAERVLGARGSHIMRRAILPNVLAPIIVLASLEFPAAVLYAAALSYLGLGAQPPTPEWGALLVDARTYIRTAPYLINIPGAAIFIVVLAFNLLGNTLRDVLDPRLRGR
ncbi:MAG TPA: nickel transporter permease [Thermomicrobiales bacterium]|jgi:peptide/nickel transport system permease protein